MQHLGPGFPWVAGEKQDTGGEVWCLFWFPDFDGYGRECSFSAAESLLETRFGQECFGSAMNSSRESSKANVCSLYVALFPGRFFFLPHFRNNRCNLKTFKTFCSSLPSICNDKKLCTSAQMCLYQIVCMTYLMWEPLENAHGHTDEIRAVEGGRGEVWVITIMEQMLHSLSFSNAFPPMHVRVGGHLERV